MHSSSDGLLCNCNSLGALFKTLILNPGVDNLCFSLDIFWPSNNLHY